MPNDDPSFAVHLAFNGNCRQAFDYYQTCFGGELMVQTLADTPHGAGMIREMQQIVVYATLKNGYFKLVGTDLADEGTIIPGNNVSIFIECGTFTERARLINQLVGRNFCTMANNNPLINVTDQFQVSWILHCGDG